MKNTQRKTVKSYITLKQRVTAAVTAVVMLAQICIPTVALATTAWSGNFESRLVTELNSPMIELVNELAAQEAYKGAYFIHKSTLGQTTLDSFYEAYPKGKPTQKPKFIGDSFVQSRLIRAQYRSLMGRYFFSGVLRSEEVEAVETTRLYENAKTYAAANNLTLGNPLNNASPAQDMIWPELKQINGKSYLVPVVHLSQNTINNKVAGHLIEFDSNATFAGIQLDFATLVAGYNSTITGLGGIINNSGSIKSPGNLTLATNATFANMGGTITAAQNLSIYSNDFYNKTLVVPYKDKNGEGTRLGAVAGISAQDGNIFIKAANHITFAGATADAGGTLKLSAAGDINILPVTTSGSSQSQEGHWKVNKSTTDLLMSRLAAEDTLSLIAGGVINITASELISTSGGIELLAKNGIHILDELEQTTIQKDDRKGKTKGTSSEFRTEAVRAILSAGKGILLDSERGDVVLRATQLTSTSGTEVYARDGKVHLLMTKELEEFHLQTTRKGTWTIKTRTEDIVHENNIQNAIVGGLQVQAMYGINVEYTGKEDATLKEQIEEYRKMPGMEWMAQLYDQSLTAAGGNVDWNAIEEVHKELKKSKTNLSPAAMAIIAICVAVVMGPAAASLNSLVSGATASALGGGALATSIGSLAGAAMAAGATTIATQAAQSLASGNNLRETLNSLDSKENLKALASSMATAGMLNAVGADSLELFKVPKDSGISLASIGNQAVQAVASATVSAGVSVSIYGGNSDDYKKAFTQNLAAHGINQLGEHMAGKIGDAFDGGDALDTALKYISHAGSGCIIGAATAKATNDNDSQGSCYAAAGGAVIGELIGSYYRDSEKVQNAKKALDDFMKENGQEVNDLLSKGWSQEQIIAKLSDGSRLPYLMARMDSLKKSGVDLAKLGAAISAFAAGASASQINIAATLGQTTAENNALSLYGSWEAILQSIDAVTVRAELFAGGVSGACLSIAIMLKDTVVLISDVQSAKDYITSGGLLGSKESYDRMMQLFNGVGVILTTNPLETLDLIAAYYKTQLDGAAGEYADGNNFTAGVVGGKNAADVYLILRTLPEIAALANKLRGSGLAIDPLHLAEMKASGVKYTPEDLIATGRTVDGQVVFLETGNSKAGLQHIIERHEIDFINKGIAKSDIGSVVMDAVTRGELVGTNSGKVFKVTYKGETKYISVGIGSNGYIVRSNPVSTWDPL